MSGIEVDICGICERNINGENIFQIFDETCTRFLEEIEEIAGVNFNGIFQQPWHICMQCYNDLLTAQKFRRKCINSYQHQTSDRKLGKVLTLEELIMEIAESPQETLNDENKTDDGVIQNINPEETFNEEIRKNTHKKQKYVKISQICEICGNIFPSKKNFAVHLRRHTNNKPYECELCLNKFYTHAELKCHMRRHTGEKPYECKHCHRKFSDYGTHKKHERTHTNDRPYSCNFCEKSFTNGFILKNHILVHTGKRAFKCKVCDKSFLYHGHLTTHLRSIFHLRNIKKAELEEKEEEN